jgi:acyl-CoA synthetase (AMP-forming)/AMP-acid ligase II
MDPNFATLWEHVAREVPERPATWQDGRATSYRDFDDRAGRLAGGLRAAGVGPGTKVACYLFNGPQYLEAVFAAFKLGAVPVNVNYRYQERELTDLLADAGAEALVFHAALTDRVRHAVGELSGLRAVIDVDTNLEDLIREHEPVEHALRGGEDPLFMYTGGTTGLPKGVVWRQRELYGSLAPPAYMEVAGRPAPAELEEALAVVRELDASGSAPRTLPVAPLMHATALFTTMGTLLLGGTAVFAPGPSLDPAAIWRTVESQRVTRLAVAGNAIARPLAEELVRAEREGRPYRIDSVKAMFSSGVAWTDDVKRMLLERQPMLLTEVLASSEGGPYAIAQVGRVEDLPSRFVLTPGTIVLDEHGEEVEPGSDRIGMLAFTGPMPRGYHDDPEKSATVFFERGGERYVMPGDFVKLHEDRSIDFLGRGSGVVNTGGEKVYPGEVEDVLLTHPDVADCAVVGVPDERWGETVAAVVALKAGKATEPELIDHVGAQLAGYKKPRHVVVVDALPRGPNAKVDLGAVRETAIRAVHRVSSPSA